MTCPKCNKSQWKWLERNVQVCVNCGMDDIPRLKPVVDKRKKPE